MAVDYHRFPKSEYENRWENARHRMAEARLDALLITEKANYVYFCGANPDFSFSRPTIFILPRSGDPICVVQHFFKDLTRRSTHVPDTRIYDNLGGAPVAMIAGALKDRGLTTGKIGFELGYEQRLGISLEDLQALTKALPGASVADNSQVVWGCRMVKSPAEIERLRQAGRITAEVYEALMPAVRAGMTEADVVDRFVRLHLERGGASPWFLINSGPENYDIACGGPADRRLASGDVLWMDGGCCVGDYWSDFTRMVFLGEPSQEQRRVYDLVVEITRKTVEAVRPGVKCSELQGLNDRLWREAGYDYNEINFAGGRIGHGMGTMITEPPHVAAYDHTVLEPGMVVTIEPGWIRPDGCFHVEDNVLVTGDGFEILSQCRRDLVVV
ncbi:MAG: M24 family metallopeptidase [Nitrospinota bacterium]